MASNLSIRMAKFSSKKIIVSLFLYILCLHAVAIFFFARGFLLTRTELSAFSHCSDIEDAPCFSTQQKQQHRQGLNESNSRFKEENVCWTKPAVDKVIIIVLDALRFDFVAPSRFFKGSRILSKFSSRGHAMDGQIASTPEDGFRRTCIC